MVCADSAQTGAFEASLGVQSSVPFPLLPYYLTLVKHYMTEQRVHRANSYPPELAFLHLYERTSLKI